MSRIGSLVIARPSASGLLITVASGTVELDVSPSSSSLILPCVPSDREVCGMMQSNVRTHFTNHGRFEMDNGLFIHYSVVCAEPCTLLYALVTEKEKSAERAQYFLTDVQGALLSEAQLLMLLPQCAENELQPHIQPMLLQLVMAENTSNNAQSQKIEDMRAQVDTVKTIMSHNVEQIMERGDRLESIQQRTDELAASSANFKLSARRVQRKMCMLNAKWTIITVVFTILLVTVIILIIMSACGVFKKN